MNLYTWHRRNLGLAITTFAHGPYMQWMNMSEKCWTLYVALWFACIMVMVSFLPRNISFFWFNKPSSNIKYSFHYFILTLYVIISCPSSGIPQAFLNIFWNLSIAIRVLFLFHRFFVLLFFYFHLLSLSVSLSAQHCHAAHHGTIEVY